ncbi:ABC transporter permease [Occallatibacter savannae]|uniref:ABC transporter permease n=1 Tax=Occallatibacter savannae TaxID=1002691 RepID=UPI000D68C49E|nr:ABC transporter permease [Occallatibacter savannae]
MAGLLGDIRFALRQLRKSPGFTFTAVLMLALAICANSTVFSWIDGTMLNPVPKARNTSELVSVMRGQWSTSPAPPFSYLDYRDLRERNHSFTGMLAYHHDWLTLTGNGMPERIYVANVSANFFDVLGIKPALGRFFLPGEEAREGGARYVVLSYSLWKNIFGGDPNIVGKPIELARQSGTIIGVAPEGFINAMPGVRHDAWVPIDPLGTDKWRMTHRSANYLNVLARLRPGVTRQQATGDLENMMRQIVVAYPTEHIGANNITLDPMWRSPFGANVYLARSLPILLAIAAFVLLLTCVNVATLALVRFVARRRQIAIRESLGAGRFQLMRQMILEGLIVSLAGGLVALALTAWTAKRFADFIPPNANPIVLNGTVDHNVIGIIVVLSMLATLICGAFPALRSSRVNAAEVLKEEAGAISGGHHRRLLSGLVVTQIALSLALLVSSALFLRTLRNMSGADPGFRQDHVLTASLALGIAGYSDKEADLIEHKILERVSAVPGIKVAALTNWLPLSFNGRNADVYPEDYVPQLHESHEVRRADVTPGYFSLMGIPLTAGRDFTRDDTRTAPPVVIVDQTLADRYWPGQNPLGRHVKIWGRLYTVIGVARNSKHQFVNEPVEPMIYRSFFQNPDDPTLMVQTTGDPDALAPAIEEAIHQVDRQLVTFDVRSLEETTRASTIFPVMASTFAAIFAIIALVLAATGIYGVISYRTQLRTHEIGIRVALGASRADVMRLVLMQGIQLTIAGLALGLALAFGLTRFIASMLYGVSPTDPITALAVVALLAVISVLACYVPAHRAMSINPVSAIREQ